MGNLRHLFSRPLPRRLRYLIVGIVVAAVTLFLLLPRGRWLFRAVPAQSSAVLEFSGLLKAKRLLEKSEDVAWQPIWQAPLFKRCFSDADAAAKLLQHDENVIRALVKNTALAAFSLNPADSLSALFAVELGYSPNLEKLLQGNKLTTKYFPHQFHGNRIFSVHLPNQPPLEIALKGETLLFSRRATLVEDALSQLGKPRNWWADRPYMADLPEAPLRLHLSPASLAEQWRSRMAPQWRRLPDLLARNVEWAGIAWSGKVLGTKVEPKGFLAKMPAWGEAPGQRLFAYLPDNTAMLLQCGLKSPPEFAAQFGSGRNEEFDRYVLPWLGDEVALAVAEPLSQALVADRMAFLAVRDSAKATAKLRAYAKARGTVPGGSGPYQMFEVWTFSDNALFRPLLGDDEAFRSPACVLLGDFVAVATDRSSLEVLLDKYLVSQTLASNVDFLQLQNQANKNSTVSFWANTAYLGAVMQAIFDEKTPPMRPLWGKNKGFVLAQARPGFGMKAHVDCRFQPLSAPIARTDILWKAPLQAHVVTQPYWVGDRVLVQDLRNVLYCFNVRNGALQWHREMPSRILSGVRGADFYSNDTWCYFFNTEQQIFALDERGNDLTGFPIRLPARTAHSVAFVDFDGSDRLHFFAACDNGHLYGFGHLGAALNGWNAVPTQGQASGPILHFQHQGRDYLAFLTKEGLLSVFGRDGSLRFGPVALPVAEQGDFGQMCADAASSAPRIYAAHSSGLLFACDLKGKCQQMALGEKPTAAEFGQLLGDARFEWAALFGKTLKTGTWGGKGVVFSANFPQKQQAAFFVPDGKMGTVDKRNRRIWLLDEKGRTVRGFPLGGNTVFEIGNLNGSRILVTGNASSLWAYRLR